MAGRRREPEVTVVLATALGGPPEFTGNFILADLATVTGLPFWEEHKNIGLIVNCIGKRYGTSKAIYPKESGRPLAVFVEVRNSRTLSSAFDTAANLARRELGKGKDVLVHCRETFHRGPGVCAGIMQKLCSVNYKVLSLLRPFSQDLMKARRPDESPRVCLRPLKALVWP
jgi:hypothetical protein